MALEGRPTVTDGDTIKLGGVAIRIHGIDAPELKQRCQVDGRHYRCGVVARQALMAKLGSRPVQCLGRGTDKYHRLIATCNVDGVDIGYWMVSQGYALAYRKYSLEYVPAEDAARTARRGLWMGKFEFPWVWRKIKR